MISDDQVNEGLNRVGDVLDVVDSPFRSPSFSIRCGLSQKGLPGFAGCEEFGRRSERRWDQPKNDLLYGKGD